MNNLMVILCFIIFSSCSNRMHQLSNIEGIKITVNPIDCIDNNTTEVNLNIQNNSGRIIRLDKDSFVFKALYSKVGEQLNPNVLYDPVIALSGKVYEIKSGKSKIVQLVFNDLEYYELPQEDFIIEFEYSNLIKKTTGIISNRIPIQGISVKHCM
jgi:hypothetical protein